MTDTKHAHIPNYTTYIKLKAQAAGSPPDQTAAQRIAQIATCSRCSQWLPRFEVQLAKG